MKDRMEQHEGYGRHHGMHSERCCRMGSEFGFHRRFWTKAEKLVMLEDYHKALRAELEAIEERLVTLKKTE